MGDRENDPKRTEPGPGDSKIIRTENVRVVRYTAYTALPLHTTRVTPGAYPARTAFRGATGYGVGLGLTSRFRALRDTVTSFTLPL